MEARPESATIVLGGRQIEVKALGFGFMRRGLPRVQRVIEWTNLRVADMPALLAGADQGLADVIEMVSAASGLPAAEIEALPATLNEAIFAALVIADLSGTIRDKEALSPGEAEAGTSTGD
jgi:hypothetical protein